MTLAIYLVIGGAARPADAPAATSSPNVATWRFCTSCVDSGGDLSRYRYVGLNAWQNGKIGSLKQSNSALKALVYKDMASTRSYSCGGLVPAGIDYCWADKQRPDWFTLDASGARIEWAGFSGTWQMDVGNSAYQDQWAANVIADLRANGWNGVVIDNANVDQGGYLAGKTMREYPTQQSYQAATRSFLANVCPKVIFAGFLCLPNIQAQPVLANARLWADWIQFTSGGTREYWMKWDYDSGGQFGDGGWSDLQSVFTTVQNAGKIFLPVTYAPTSDSRSIRYGRASFLLRWNGGPSAFIFAPTPEAQDPWSPEWTTDIGAPVGEPVQVGTGWRRTFSGGAVVVNPSQFETATIPLGGSYRTADGKTTTTVTLAPMSGLVLTALAPPPPPPTTPTAITLTAVTTNSRTVALGWGGASTGTIDMYRDGALFATVANSGSYRERAPKVSTAPKYKVCEARSTTCSPEVAASGWTNRRLASSSRSRPDQWVKVPLARHGATQSRRAERVRSVWIRIARAARP